MKNDQPDKVALSKMNLKRCPLCKEYPVMNMSLYDTFIECQKSPTPRCKEREVKKFEVCRDALIDWNSHAHRIEKKVKNKESAYNLIVQMDDMLMSGKYSIDELNELKRLFVVSMSRLNHIDAEYELRKRDDNHVMYVKKGLMTYQIFFDSVKNVDDQSRAVAKLLTI